MGYCSFVEVFLEQIKALDYLAGSRELLERFDLHKEGLLEGGVMWGGWVYYNRLHLLIAVWCLK